MDMSGANGTRSKEDRPPMPKSRFVIRKVTMEDVPAIVDLHMQVLNWTINGRLGHEHVASIYSCLLKVDEVFAFAAFRDDKLLAFQVSTTNFSVIRDHLFSLIDMRKKVRLFFNCLRHPLDFVALVESVLLVMPAMKRVGHTAEIVAWAGEPGNPIASLVAHDCLMRSLATLYENGHEYCLGQFLKPNDRARKYFENLGIAPLHSYWRNDLFLLECKVGCGNKSIVGVHQE